LAQQNRGKLDATLNDYACALEFAPRRTVALNNRASAKHDRCDLREALKDYNRAIEIHPQLVLFYCNRGMRHGATYDQIRLSLVANYYSRLADYYSGLVDQFPRASPSRLYLAHKRLFRIARSHRKGDSPWPG